MSNQLTIEEIISYESRFVQKWSKEDTYCIKGLSTKPKYYVLVMFPYPSGKIHMGHVRNYSLGDVLARYKRLKGFHVLHPIGWDSFGLPAENAAIKNKTHPAKWTHSNIEVMKSQLKRMGFSYDWNREVATCTPEYYRWNQYIFLKFFEKGWAYKQKAQVNWCEECKTVLANEQVLDGSCWRHQDQKIEKKELSQWFFKITEFSDELLKGHQSLKDQWPNRVLAMQKNWIGRSKGTLVCFKIFDNLSLEVFTTRVDTIYGVTFIVVAPEHQILKEIQDDEYQDKMQAFKKKVLAMSEVDRENTTLKEGLFTGLEAKHPFLDKKIPIYTANFVLPRYGTGAVMSVPAHDQRDFEFAQKYNLPIIRVISSNKERKNGEPIKKAFTEDGFLINSGEHTNLTSAEARKQITQKLSEEKIGGEKIQYRIHDWLISRQRYWGTPIPIVYCKDCGIVPIEESELPVLLPHDVDFKRNKNSLADQADFLKTNCPKCKKEAERETDTMDTFVDSSWYFLRYISPHQKEVPIDHELARYFMPVDKCIGGIEHANMHLLYARYFMHALKKLNLIGEVETEPFKDLLTQGMVLKDGKAMSKSLGNIVDPDELIKKYGADTLRIFSLFAAPAEKDLDWSEFAVEGSFRMLKRLYRFVEDKRDSVGLCFLLKEPEINLNQKMTLQLMQATHMMIKTITDDMERFSCNTSIARLMEMLNFYYLHYFERKKDEFEVSEIKTLSFSLSAFLIMFMPFAPFVSLELLFRMGLSKEEELVWPIYHEKYLLKNIMTIIIQINGKMKGQIEVDISSDEKKIISDAKLDTKINRHLQGKVIRRTIYVSKKLINFVV